MAMPPGIGAIDTECLPLRDEVWPKFLRTNALRVLGLDD